MNRDSYLVDRCEAFPVVGACIDKDAAWQCLRGKQIELSS
jgi:hypothetical protein